MTKAKTPSSSTTPTSPSASAASTPAASPLPGPTDQVHCPYRRASLLQQSLTPDKMRIAFFLGAGCPVSVRIPDGASTKALIPNIEGLTKYVCEALDKSAASKTSAAAVIKRLRDGGLANPNIEDILSHVRSLHDIVGASTIDGLTKAQLADLDTAICKHTTELVSVSLPDENTPYHQLATWIGGIHRGHPVEVFTSNYDLLMEQALEQRKVPYFDGFVGSYRTFFDLSSIEQDGLPHRWARLWKVHGSINWWRNQAGDIERREKGDPSDRQMIHPSHLKYDQSRRMPYLAMLDRLRDFLSAGQAVLVTCGYSFSDQHLNDVIIQGLRGNPNAVCYALIFGDRNTVPEVVARAKRQANLNLLAADGAVFGTTERPWHSSPNNEHPLHSLAVQIGAMGLRSTAPESQCKFLLGDFKAFGDFLAQQLSCEETDKEASNAT